MKLAITKENLINGLTAVQNAVSSRTTMPALGNILIKAQEGSVELTATDLDLTIVANVKAEVETAGAITLPARRFFSLVREMSTPEIILKLDDDNNCIVESGPSYYRMKGLGIEEFPNIPPVSTETAITIPQQTVRDMLRKTSFAISNDETRYVLNGVYATVQDNKMAMVATDGKRLALSEEDLDVPSDFKADMIIPPKAITELMKLLTETGDVEIAIAGNRVSFSFAHGEDSTICLLSKLIEGKYPSFKQVIPEESENRVEIGREELFHAVRRIQLMTTEQFSSIRLEFSGNKIEITINSPGVGEAREVIPVNYKGEEKIMAFNPNFLIEPLRVLDEDEIFLEFTDELSPALIKVKKPYLCLIMPIRSKSS
ncbi:MAG: DNA polymerase III subunit beta [Verrucomicrobia bacterium]|nr:DNA polymerase III subunit beta [Verrucomicrobiota bacterium]MCF7708964.1 DNA polymerase III subunit beta [Verrucomicrobiota bacterium]